MVIVHYTLHWEWLHAHGYLAGRQKHLHTIDRSIFCWFAVTGTIHFVVEGGAMITCSACYCCDAH